MTGKQRAEYRKQAHALDPVLHIGKGGLTDAVINQLEEALSTRELVKIKVLLETSPDMPKDIAPQIAGALGAEVIQVIGGCIVFYKYNSKLHELERQKKENIKKAAAVRKKKETEAAAKKEKSKR